MKRLLAILLALLLLGCTPALAATSATTNMPLATRTGPGTRYSEVGTFLRAGEEVIVHTKAYDAANGVWWVQVEFAYAGRNYRVYTGAQRLNVNLWDVPEERVLEYSYMLDSMYGYAGPGYGYAYYDDLFIHRETNCSIMEVEGEFALIDTNSSWPGANCRVWVPIDAVAGGGKYYGENTYQDDEFGLRGEWCQIIASTANVRSGPGTQYSVVTGVKEGQWYEIIDSTVGSTGKLWYYICVDNNYGWISSGVTNMER